MTDDRHERLLQVYVPIGMRKRLEDLGRARMYESFSEFVRHILRCELNRADMSVWPEKQPTDCDESNHDDEAHKRHGDHEAPIV